MSDILIRGMEKPGSCRECDFCEVQDINFETLYFCNRNDRFLDDEEACNVPSDCPISAGWVSVKEEMAPLKRLFPCAVVPVHRKYWMIKLLQQDRPGVWEYGPGRPLEPGLTVVQWYKLPDPVVKLEGGDGNE